MTEELVSTFQRISLYIYIYVCVWACVRSFSYAIVVAVVDAVVSWLVGWMGGCIFSHFLKDVPSLFFSHLLFCHCETEEKNFSKTVMVRTSVQLKC